MNLANQNASHAGFRPRIEPTVTFEPISAEKICSILRVTRSAYYYSEQAREVALRIIAVLSPRWEICLRRTAHNDFERSGPGERVDLVVRTSNPDADVKSGISASVSFFAGGASIASFDSNFDGEEPAIRNGLSNFPVFLNELSGSELKAPRISFRTTIDAARDIRPILSECSPEILAPEDLRGRDGAESELTVFPSYPNHIVIRGAPGVVRLVPFHEPDAYLVELDPSRSTEIAPKEQVLTLPVPFSPEPNLLYPLDNLAAPWMVELLCAIFELHGKKYYPEGRRFDVSLDDQQVGELAEKMLPLPYFERGALVEAVSVFVRCSKWHGPVTARLLNLAVELVLEKYSEMRKVAQRIAGRELSFTEVSLMEETSPAIAAIANRFQKKFESDLRRRLAVDNDGPVISN